MVINVENTIDNNITKHLLEGQSLKLILPHHTPTQNFNAGDGEINMNIGKSASNEKEVRKPGCLEH